MLLLVVPDRHGCAEPRGARGRVQPDPQLYTRRHALARPDTCREKICRTKFVVGETALVLHADTEGAEAENRPGVRLGAPVALVVVARTQSGLAPGAAERGREAEICSSSPRRIGERRLERVPGGDAGCGKGERPQSRSRRQPRLGQSYLPLPYTPHGNVCTEEQDAELLAGSNVERAQVRHDSQSLVWVFCPQGLPLPPDPNFSELLVQTGGSAPVRDVEVRQHGDAAMPQSQRPRERDQRPQRDPVRSSSPHAGGCHRRKRTLFLSR